MDEAKNIIKPLLVLLLIIAATVVLYYGRQFLIPISFGVIFAFLVRPVDTWLRKKNLNKYLAAIASVLLIVAFFAGLLSIFSWQIADIFEKSDEIKETLTQKHRQLNEFIQHQFGIERGTQEKYEEEALENLKKQATSFLGSSGAAFSNFFLALIYAILLLTERTRIKNFFYKIIDKKRRATRTISETSDVVQGYLIGKLIIISILSVFYAIGFLIAGIEYAVLIAVFAAVLSFIPYIGNIIGGGVAIIVTLATGGSNTDILVILGVMIVAQLIESYLLEPWIVGNNVDLNPLFSILSVVALGLIWGAAGAIIALPLAGMAKIFFDNFPTYQPIGYLMGNDVEKKE